MADELTWVPAWRISERIRAKEVSPVEVLEHFLGRIEQHQGTLRAFVHLDEGRARQDAKAAESAVLEGEELGPLHGIPMAVKSHLDIEGLPQTPPFGTDIAKDDDLIVERLRGAGAVIVGHTGMPIYASDGSFDYEATARNPWDPSRTPGISSAGSAAAVAAGLLPVALGSDGGGSTRPSRRLLRDRGRPPHRWDGPLARRVAEQRHVDDRAHGARRARRRHPAVGDRRTRRA